MRHALIILAAGLIQTTAFSDIIATHGGLVHTGQVVRATATGVDIKVGENEFTVLRQDVMRAEIAKPAGVEKSLAAFRAGKYSEALTGFRAIVDRYAGLPLPWAEECVLRYGDTLLALKDYAGAAKAYETFKADYPDKAQLLDAKTARILFEQGQPDKAVQKIQPMLTALFKREYLTDDQEASVADGLVLLGDCLVADGKKDEALDNYLKVITLYDVDPDLTVDARYKSAKLLEQRGNWRRAKQTYDELVKENPDAAFIPDVKKRVADLSKAHHD